MTRKTITDVRERIDRLNNAWQDREFSFTCYGGGTNRYQLVDSNTGETFGPVCLGASEFLTGIEMFSVGRYTERQGK